MNEGLEAQLVEQRVTYTLEMDGKFYIVENVPARVDEETGEQFFAPSTVERLQGTILGQAEPSKVIEVPVYVYRD
jgi:hypothetical protein